MANPANARILESLSRDSGLRDRMEGFWLEPAHRQVATWTEHRDINEVMLATSLVPEGFLVLPERQRPNG